MKAFCQAVHDLSREFIWALLYGAFAALIMTSFVFSASRIREDIGSAKFISAYRRSGVSLLVPQIGEAAYNIPEDMNEDPEWQAPQRTLMEIFREGFSAGGKLGSMAQLPYPDPELFDGMIIVVGRMIDMTGFPVPKDGDMYFAVSEDLEHMVGTAFAIDGNEFAIDAAVPDGIRIGSLYNSVKASNAKRTLFVFARDFEKPYRLFWYSPEHFLPSLVAVGATQDEKAELMKAIYQRNGAIAELMDADDFLKLSGDRGLKYSLLRLVFYAVAAAAVISAMAMNLARVLQAHRGDHAVHRLFGASKAHVFMRMLFTALGFNIAPMLYTAKRVFLPVGYEYSETGGESARVLLPYSRQTVVTMLLAFGAVLLLAAAVVVTEFIAFDKRYSNGLRRE